MRKLRKSTTVRLADFRNSQVGKVVGHVEIVDKPLIAPLSGRECASYYVHVEHEVSAGEDSHWKTIIEEEVACKYVIKEGEHYAYVNDDKLESHIVQDEEFSSGFGNDAEEALEQYLKSKGHKSENLLGWNKTMRYREGVLEPGEEMAVLGEGNWKASNKLGLPAKYGKVLELSSNRELSVYLSDHPGTTKKKFNRYYRDENGYSK